MRTNTHCTLYNQYRNEQTGEIEVHTTHLRAVFWESRKGTAGTQSGMASANTVRVFIPDTVEAEGKRYLDPVRYAALPPDAVSDHWTLREGVDALAKGETPPVCSVKELKALLPSLYEHCKLTEAAHKGYGSARMQHWEASGK